jgi:hypothetical protein
MNVSSEVTEQAATDGGRKPTLRHRLEHTYRFIVAVALARAAG